MIEWFKDRPGEDALIPKRKGWIRWLFSPDGTYISEPVTNFVMKIGVLAYFVILAILGITWILSLL